MVAEKIQAVIDKEKPWFDLARMVLTALGFAIACVVGVRYVVGRHGANHLELVMYLLPLTAPLVFAVFLIFKIVSVLDRVIDVAFPRIITPERLWYSRAMWLVLMFFATYSACGVLYMIIGAMPLPHP